MNELTRNGYKVGEWVTSEIFSGDKVIQLERSDFQGISAKSNEWFKSLRPYKLSEEDLMNMSVRELMDLILAEQ